MDFENVDAFRLARFISEYSSVEWVVIAAIWPLRAGRTTSGGEKKH